MKKIDTTSFLDDFENEARTHIEKIESAFLSADMQSADPALMDEVFRAAHSLKGTAGFFSLDKIVAVAHELESVFTKIKNGELAAEEDITEAVLQSVDCLKDLTDNLNSPGAVETSAVIERLKAYSSPGDAASKPITATGISFDLDILKNAFKRGHWGYFIKIDFSKRLGKYTGNTKELLDEILSVGAIAEARTGGDEFKGDAIPDKLLEALSAKNPPSLEMLVTSVLEPELFLIAVELPSEFVHLIPKETAGGKAEEVKHEIDSVQIASSPPKTDFSIRLDVSVVNGLMDLANEMILARNQLLSSTSTYHKNIPGLTPVLLELNRLSSEIQEKVMRTRMQPINMIFKKFPRIIHDTARLLKKDINIELLGGDVALDKYLLDALSDPITQLVKNSADHGIETAGRRAVLGKPPSGLITLNAYMHDGLAIIEVTDDGAGIDIDALKKKCVERGVATEDQLAFMPDSLLYAFIFEPGFSTAQNVTSVSGRGVGMDIVKTNIERLSGNIEIESRQNKGTTIRLKMPLTLSLVSTLIVEINSIKYAVPEANVERILRITKDSPEKLLERIGGSFVLNMNGWIVPVVTMDEIDAAAKGIDLRPADSDACMNKHAVKCLLLKTGERFFALLIGEAVETEETLVNPLPVYLRQCRCYSNVAVLGSGETVMILSAEGIMRLTGIGGVERNQTVSVSTSEDTRQVIVFQCSGPEHFAIDTDCVARIERVSPGHIQEIGDKLYVNISGRSVRVLKPEDYAPVQKHYYNEGTRYLVMLKSGSGTDTPLALLAGRVPNRIEGEFSFDNSLIESEYVLGTDVYHEKILIFLNIDEIIRSGEK